RPRASSDNAKSVAPAPGDGRLDDWKKRRDAARKAGKKYGIGFAAVVEPAMYNIGMPPARLTPGARDKAGPKNGSPSMVTVSVDPVGPLSVTADVNGQGPGRAT